MTTALQPYATRASTRTLARVFGAVLLVVLIGLWVIPSAEATQQIVRIKPNGMTVNSGTFTAGGSCTTFGCVNQNFGIGDSTYLTTGTAAATATLDLGSVPALNGQNVTAAKIVFRSQCVNGTSSAVTQDVNLRNGATTIATLAATNVPAGAQTKVSGGWTTISVNEATANALTLQLVTTPCSGGGDTSRIIYDTEVYLRYTGTAGLITSYLRPVPGTNASGWSNCSGSASQCMVEAVGGSDSTYTQTSNINEGTTHSFPLTDLPAQYQGELVTSIATNATASCASNGGAAGQNANIDIGGTNYAAITITTGSQTPSDTFGTPAAVSFTGAGLNVATVEMRASQRCANNPENRRFYAIEAEVTHTTSTPFTGTAVTAAGAGWGSCDGTTQNVVLLIDGIEAERAACTAGTGAYAFANLPITGQTYAVMLDTVGSSRGATFGKATTSNIISGVQVRSGFVGAVGTNVTTTDLVGFGSTVLAASPIEAPTGALTIASIVSGIVTQIESGATLTASIEFHTGSLRIMAGGTYNGGSVYTILHGGGSGNCSGTTPLRSFCPLGTFNAQTGTVSFQPYNQSSFAVPGATYNALDIAPEYPGQAVTAELGTTDAATITAATWNFSTLNVASIAATTTTASPTINLAGALTIPADVTLGGSGTGTFTVGGNMTGVGDVNFTGGTVELRSGAAQTINPTGQPWQFATLGFGSTATRTVTLTAGSAQIRTSVDLRVGRTGDAGVVTFNASGANNSIRATNTLTTIVSRGTFQPAPTTTVVGNLVNGGTFTAGSAYLYLSGNFTNTGTYTPNTSNLILTGPTATTFTNSGTATVGNLTVAVGGKVVRFASTLTLSGALSITGGSCASPVVLQSSVAGTQRALTTTGVAASVNYATISDLAPTTVIAASNSNNLGGNGANVSFGGFSCTSIVPNGDGTTIGTVGVAGPAPCASGARWECVNENADTPTDTDYVTFGNATASQRYELSSTTITTKVVGVTVRARARTTSGTCTDSVALYRSNNTLIAMRTFTATTTMSNYGDSSFGLNLDQTEVDGLYIVTGTTCGGTTQWAAIDVILVQDAFTVSGVADNPAICDGTTPVIGIAVGTAKYATVPCDATSRIFYANPLITGTDTIAVYYDGVAGGLANRGATWVRPAASSPSQTVGIQLNRTRYRTEARAAGTPLGATDLGRWDGDDDADIPLTATASFITLTDPAAALEIGTNRLTPNASIIAPRVWVRNGATLDPVGNTIQVSAFGGVGTCTDAAIDRPFCVAPSGTFTPGVGTVQYIGDGPVLVSGYTYANLNVSGGVSSVFQLGAVGETNITAATYVQSGIADTSVASPTINVLGSVYLAGGTLQGSGSGTITVAGDFSGPGDVNLTAGAVELRDNNNHQFGEASTTASTAWRFATLGISTSSGGGRAVNIPTSNREIRVSNTLRVGLAADSVNTQWNAINATEPLTVTGNIVNTSRGQVMFPQNTVLHGNFVDSGQLTSANTMLTFAGTGTSTLNMNVSPFDDITVSAGKTLSLGSNVNMGTMALNGTSCSNLATLNSTVPGTARSLNNSALTATNGAFQDITSTNPRTVTSSRNLGNNTNITYGANPCGTVQGTVSDTSICNGSTGVVGVAVNGTKFGTVPCTAGTGAYQASPTWASGDIVTVYYDNTTPKGSVHVRTGASSGTPLTSVELWSNEVHLESLSGTAMTTTDINQYDGDNDADIEIRYPVSSRLESTAFGLVVDAGTFRPGTDVRTPHFWVTPAGTYDATSTRMEVTATDAGACNAGTSGRPFCIIGGFTQGTGTVSYMGASGTPLVSAGTYANLEVSSTGTTTFQLAAGTTTASSITVTGSGTPTLTTSTTSPTVNVTGSVAVNGTTTLGGSGTGTMSIAGNLTGTGNVNFTAGTVELRSAGAAQQLNAGGTLPGTAWQFATLIASTATGARTVTVPATSREIRASTLLQVGRATDANTTTLDASALTRPITVTGDLVIANSRGWFTMPPVTELHGNFTQDGWTAPGTGVLRIRGSGTSTVTGVGGGGVYDVLIDAPSKVVAVGSDFAAHVMTLDGGSCATPVTLRSTVNGTPRGIYGTTLSTQYASIRDMNFNLASIANDAGDLGGNTNITFTGAPCAAATTPYTDSTNASAGAAQPTTIDGRAAFHMSAVNGSGATVDRYRTEVRTSLLDSSVRALFPLDGSGSDRSATANTASSSNLPTYGAGATNFGQAASFDGVDDRLDAPNNAAYNVSAFTVEFWMRASGYGSDPYPKMVSRNLSGQFHFNVGLDTAQRTLSGLVTYNGGTMAVTSTPADPWLDNTWHHVAFTVSASKALRLYVDGVAYGNPVSYSGTLDMPARPITIGGDGSSVSDYVGQLDDVQFTAGAPDPVAIAGYAATKRPHAQSIWQSTGYGTNSGAALSGSCAVATRCADIVYGGTGIREDGARYFAAHQLRTTAGLWSAPVSDWFETRDGIVVSAPASVPLPTGVPGVDRTTSFNVSTTCSNPAGCALQMTTPSDTIGMLDGTGANTTTVPLFTRGAPTAWTAGASSGLGFTVLASSDGKNTSTWGTGTDFSNLALLNFTGVGRAPVNLQQMNSGAETTSVGVRLNVPTTQKPGTYSGTVDVIALDSP